MKKIIFKVFGKCHSMVLALSLELELVLFLKSLNHAFIHMQSDLEFPCTNNEAEYEALIQGLTLALQMQVKYLVVTGDS
jgi:hypothetical protein